MKSLPGFFLLLLIPFASAAQSDTLPLPGRNQQIIDTVLQYGQAISPTYEEAVCTEFLIGILGHFIELSPADTVNVRIDIPKNSDIYGMIAEDAPEMRGVYYALTSNGKGEPIDDWTQVRAGDFVQFWYYRSWGHCGIVHSIDLENKVMKLYSSYPSTGGYGIQPFVIPEYTHFVRLK
jgi:hypothetical protein